MGDSGLEVHWKEFDELKWRRRCTAMDDQNVHVYRR